MDDAPFVSMATAQPLEGVQSFDARHFRFLVLRQKYIELLCIKCEAGANAGHSVDSAVDEVRRFKNDRMIPKIIVENCSI